MQLNKRYNTQEWKKQHNDFINYFYKTICDFEMKKIDFHEFKSRLVGSAAGLEKHINFKHSIYSLIDTWFELLEFCYLEEYWFKYGLEAGYFIINGLKEFPKEVFLSDDSDFVSEQLYKYTT